MNSNPCDRRRLYSIGWKKIKFNDNFITVQVTCLDERGQIIRLQKNYEEWMGVCTDRIESVVSEMKLFFPGMNIRYQKLCCTETLSLSYKMVLPYFATRLKNKKLDYESHSFYKIYMDGCVEDVGSFFANKYEIAYFHKSDWLVRIYIDLCTQYQTKSGFYYRWYDVDIQNPNLVSAFQMVSSTTSIQQQQHPNFKIAAFDLETVPSPDQPSRVPNGIDPGDRIVMISIVKWNNNDNTSSEEMVLYLNPINESLQIVQEPNNKKYIEYQSEKDLLNDFHCLIQDCHVLTGYNINSFDIPCVFARLLWLRMYNVLAMYSSAKIGDYLITTFQNKIVIDMYHYFHIFSNYDLSSFKLDTVAKTKLGGDDGKLAIDSVGIHSWYNNNRENILTRQVCLSTDVKYCYDMIKPHSFVKRFGTFLQYLEYCLRDSQLVYKLFMKEMVLGFLIARANFVALDVVQAMHFGNSRFLLEVVKSYGTLLGYFINMDFFNNHTDGSKYASVFTGGTYQGALNYCLSEKYFENVVVLDFMSMYPISLLSANLCYGTCDILTTKEYLEQVDDTLKDRLTTIPYRIHSDRDFVQQQQQHTHSNQHLDKNFSYPKFDPDKDQFVIVINQNEQGFLPTIVKHFLDLRKFHQKEWKTTRNVVHYNSQLCIKLLVNSMYGTMASKDSQLAYIVIAMAITNLARYQLLGSYQYVERLGYNVCYADTDSLMVHGWPTDDCDIVNQYLNLPYVDLKYEQRMDRLLILSKKRYVYEARGQLVSKGFQKKINGLVKFMSDKFIQSVMSLCGTSGDPSDGWILWVNTLLETQFMCRDPMKYAVTRKTKKMNEYISKSCPAVKMLQKYPEKEGGYIDYTYSRADVAAKEASNWIMDVQDVRYVDFEQLFMSQKKIFYTILNIGFWKLPDPQFHCQMVINTIRWKYFVHAELKHYFQTKKKKLALLVEKGIKYTFKINDCVNTFGKKRRSVVKKSLNNTSTVKTRKRKMCNKKIDLADEYKNNCTTTTTKQTCK